MDSAHALAVVCRAKQMCRENELVPPDEVLGYLCQSADINGTWSRLLRGDRCAAPAGEADHALWQGVPLRHTLDPL